MNILKTFKAKLNSNLINLNKKMNLYNVKNINFRLNLII